MEFCSTRHRIEHQGAGHPRWVPSRPRSSLAILPLQARGVSPPHRLYHILRPEHLCTGASTPSPTQRTARLPPSPFPPCAPGSCPPSQTQPSRPSSSHRTSTASPTSRSPRSPNSSAPPRSNSRRSGSSRCTAQSTRHVASSARRSSPHRLRKAIPPSPRTPPSSTPRTRSPWRRFHAAAGPRGQARIATGGAAGSCALRWCGSARRRREWARSRRS